MNKSLLFIIIITLFSIFKVNADSYDLSTIPANYNGSIKVEMEGQKINESSDMTISTKLENNAITLQIHNFSINVDGTEFQLEEITIPDVLIYKNGEITQGETIINHPTLGQLPIFVKGTMTDKAASLTITIDYQPDVVVGLNGSASTSTLASINDRAIDCVIGNNYIIIENAVIKSYSLYNISGSNMKVKNSVSNRIDFDNIPTGIYIVDIITNKGRVTRKIVIK